ncbi:hypothetical protein FJZ28_00620 [Candidatus Peregrinibacteria bacterium]|nr:hypothetical protein [Candidatus Peregrinibacteria bacterium]
MPIPSKPLLATLLLGAIASLSVQNIERAAAQDNPFDLQPAVESPSTPQPEQNRDQTKTFYRAGKEVQAKSEPATLPTSNTPANDSPFDMIENPTPVEEQETQEQEEILEQPAETPAPEEAVNEEDTEEENAVHSAAPRSGMSTFDMIQYASIAFACFGGLIVFMFLRKKKGRTSAVAAPAPQVSGGAPVDSERVKKALAAFHDDAAIKAAA